jgi:hypothetical protein
VLLLLLLLLPASSLGVPLHPAAVASMLLRCYAAPSTVDIF